MPSVLRLTDDEVKVIADAVLAREMVDLSFEGAEVRSALDYDEAPSFFVTARVGRGIATLSGDRIGRIHGALHDALLAQGEERFPYLQLARADDEVPSENPSEGRS